ncbi:MAG TPA: hypothetical protein VLB47_06680, partial [Solirubrobacteraceae bacterium]|nr:hypothetical protein [Solirubrobacteraceae bacterium]
RPVTLAAARAQVRFPVRVPRALGAPDEVRLWRALPGGVVILVYGHRTALWAFRGSSTELVAKMVTPDTIVRPVRVGAARGTWLTGAPLQFVVQGRDGAIVTGTAATVDANVLVWSAGGVAYRLETRAGLGRALAIARSL